MGTWRHDVPNSLPLPQALTRITQPNRGYHETRCSNFTHASWDMCMRSLNEPAYQTQLSSVASTASTSQAHAASNKASPTSKVCKHDWGCEDVAAFRQQKPTGLSQFRSMKPPMSCIAFSHTKIKAHSFEPSHVFRPLLRALSLWLMDTPDCPTKAQ